MHCHVEPFLKRMNISLSLVLARIEIGNASSMRRLPVCGLTAVQIALRACAYSGRQCQKLPTRSHAAPRCDAGNVILAGAPMPHRHRALAAVLAEIFPQLDLVRSRRPPVVRQRDLGHHLFLAFEYVADRRPRCRPRRPRRSAVALRGPSRAPTAYAVGTQFGVLALAVLRNAGHDPHRRVRVGPAQRPNIRWHS